MGRSLRESRAQCRRAISAGNFSAGEAPIVCFAEVGNRTRCAIGRDPIGLRNRADAAPRWGGDALQRPWRSQPTSRTRSEGRAGTKNRSHPARSSVESARSANTPREIRTAVGTRWVMSVVTPSLLARCGPRRVAPRRGAKHPIRWETSRGRGHGGCPVGTEPESWLPHDRSRRWAPLVLSPAAAGPPEHEVGTHPRACPALRAHEIVEASPLHLRPRPPLDKDRQAMHIDMHENDAHPEGRPREQGCRADRHLGEDRSRPRWPRGSHRARGSAPARGTWRFGAPARVTASSPIRGAALVILVDTSIWVDHFRSSSTELARALTEGVLP